MMHIPLTQEKNTVVKYKRVRRGMCIFKLIFHVSFWKCYNQKGKSDLSNNYCSGNLIITNHLEKIARDDLTALYTFIG